MSQYFENDTTIKDEPFIFHFSIQNKEYKLQSNNGVFSKDKLDTGTKILLECVLKEEKEVQRVLDLGCGIGPVGLVMAHHFDCDLTMIDINERAVELARQNMASFQSRCTIKCQDGLKQEDGFFDCILLNPPIRTGKKVVYSLFDQCIEHLKGNFYVVMRKQHGAQSAMKYLEEKGCCVERMYRDKGFWVLKIYWQ
ncbi:class I SAM-dependent methyltransferase [Floccifex sp.]|uniref:class I SAM-dependent methyltransferase n=1 Tax=Floccifex sp. TaxID=2815810 RepID=UPI003F10C287